MGENEVYFCDICTQLKALAEPYPGNCMKYLRDVLVIYYAFFLSYRYRKHTIITKEGESEKKIYETKNKNKSLKVCN